MTEELEGVKAEMDEKGTSMTDAGPLVRVKQALTRLKTECTQMDIRIGVVSRMTQYKASGTMCLCINVVLIAICISL